MKLNSRTTKTSTSDELASEMKVAKSYSGKNMKDSREEPSTEAKLSSRFFRSKSERKAPKDNVVEGDDNGKKFKLRLKKSSKNITDEGEKNYKKSKSKSKSKKDSLAKRMILKMVIGSSSDAKILALMNTTTKNVGEVFPKNIEVTLDESADKEPKSEERDDSIAARDGCSESRTTECESMIRSNLSVEAERDQEIEISMDDDTTRSEIGGEFSTDNSTMKGLNIEDDKELDQTEENSAEQKEEVSLEIKDMNTGKISKEDMNQADGVDTEKDDVVKNAKLSTDTDDDIPFIESVPSILDMNTPVQGVFDEGDAFFDDNDKQRDNKDCAAGCIFLSLFQTKK